jgi:Pyruvate/2-oxoacid:ferredoxin oxidoreductase gamma subunit
MGQTYMNQLPHELQDAALQLTDHFQNLSNCDRNTAMVSACSVIVGIHNGKHNDKTLQFMFGWTDNMRSIRDTVEMITRAA